MSRLEELENKEKELNYKLKVLEREIAKEKNKYRLCEKDKLLITELYSAINSIEPVVYVRFNTQFLGEYQIDLLNELERCIIMCNIKGNTESDCSNMKMYKIDELI